jgi:hypothetical protein
MDVNFVESTLDRIQTLLVSNLLVRISLYVVFKSEKITNRDTFIGIQNFRVGAY